MLPSWLVHKKWCLRVCGKYYQEIDKLIDSPGEHDLGARDPNILLRQIHSISREYGPTGICCYLLHHILDEIRDQLISFKASGISEEGLISVLVESNCSIAIPLSLKIIKRKTSPNDYMLHLIENSLNHIIKAICEHRILREIIDNIMQDSRTTRAIKVASINTIIGELVNEIEDSLGKIFLSKYGVERYLALYNEIRYSKTFLANILIKFFHRLFRDVYRPHSIEEAKSIIFRFKDEIVERIVKCIEEGKAINTCILAVAMYFDSSK